MLTDLRVGSRVWKGRRAGTVTLLVGSDRAWIRFGSRLELVSVPDLNDSPPLKTKPSQLSRPHAPHAPPRLAGSLQTYQPKPGACSHHWQLNSWSHGECLKCGAKC